MRLMTGSLPSPVGPLLLVWDEDATLRALDFADYEPRLRRLLQRYYGAAEPAPAAVPQAFVVPLGAYFAGAFAALDGIAIGTGGSAFQRLVWAALRAIPPGVTESYGSLAARIGRPSAVRAVGLANGANPIAIIVPCHRVIGADASLTGYAGGLPRKRWLLEHEGVRLADPAARRSAA